MHGGTVVLDCKSKLRHRLHGIPTPNCVTACVLGHHVLLGRNAGIRADVH